MSRISASKIHTWQPILGSISNILYSMDSKNRLICDRMEIYIFKYVNMFKTVEPSQGNFTWKIWASLHKLWPTVDTPHQGGVLTFSLTNKKAKPQIYDGDIGLQTLTPISGRCFLSCYQRQPHRLNWTQGRQNRVQLLFLHAPKFIQSRNRF